MKAILVFVDGTMCDTRPRHHLIGTPDFYRRKEMLKDLPVPGSRICLQELARQYEIVYIGARPAFTLAYTEEWLEKTGFPEAPVYLAQTHEERLALVKDIFGKLDFIAGIGDRWDDNELHVELGILSIILQEFEGKWNTVSQRVIEYHRQKKTEENEIHLKGKIEGLARVLPLLVSKYGEGLWEAYFESVLEMAETSRVVREKEDLESFAKYGFKPTDLRDVAKWYEVIDEAEWEQNPAFGLQDAETVEATEHRNVVKVTRCRYAELWQEHGRPDIGYQIHCHTDNAWWDRPAWNPIVRFMQPKTLMQGDGCCLFVQYLPHDE